MSFWPVYIALAVVFFVYKRYGSFVSMSIGAAVGLFHWLLVGPLVNLATAMPTVSLMGDDVESIFFFHMVMFLLVFGWFIILERLKLRYSAIIAAVFLLMNMIMIYDAVNFPFVETFVDNLYGTIVVIINVSMFVAGWLDRDCVAISNSAISLHPSSHNHKGVN